MMKTIDFKNIKEKVYFEKLSNGIDVYLYPTNKSKNFYCTFSTRYGSNITSYKKGNKNIEVIPGTAHFLEHKLMNFTTNLDFYKRINKLGSVANAYTTYDVTNYNIFGGENILENLSLILDMVMTLDINDETVESEKGIITEEIDMDKDDINTSLYIKKNQNLFHKDFPLYHILGEKQDINRMTSKYLKMIYNDFYRPDNMFIIVVGNFNKEEVLEFLMKYMKSFKSKNIDKIKINKIKEPDIVKVEYEKVHRNVSEDKVYYSIKINKKIFKDIKEDSLLYYIKILLSSNFSATSSLYERYKTENLITSLKSDYKIFNNQIIITVKASTPDSELFIKNLEKDIKKINVDELTFERKRKKILSELILSFENIEDVEYLITVNILKHKRLYNKDYDLIKSLDFKEMQKIISRLEFTNKSILICTK